MINIAVNASCGVAIAIWALRQMARKLERPVRLPDPPIHVTVVPRTEASS